MLICRKCEKPASDCRYDWGNEIVVFNYSHNQMGAAPIEHKWNSLICDAGYYAKEDKERRVSA